MLQLLALGDGLERLSEQLAERLERGRHRGVLHQLRVVLMVRKRFVEYLDAPLDVVAVLLILVDRAGRLLDLARHPDDLGDAAPRRDHPEKTENNLHMWNTNQRNSLMNEQR